MLAVILLNLVSTATGFLREILVGRTYGATMETDAFFGAFGFISLLFFLFTGGALQGAFMPRYLRLNEAGENGHAASLFRQTAVVAGTVTLVLILVIELMSERFIGILYPGFDIETTALASKMTRFLAPVIFFTTLGNLFQAVLHARNKFLAPACIPPSVNIVVICSIFFFGQLWGIEALSYGYLVGNSLWMMLLPLCFLYLVPVGRVDDEARKAVGSAFSFLALLLIVDQISGVVQRSLLSQYESGLISAFAYGTKIAGLPIGILVGALTIVLFPRLVSAISSQSAKDSGSFVSLASCTVLCVMTPAALFVFFQSEFIIRLIFGSSAFSESALANTMIVLKVYSAALPAQALILFGLKVHVAAGKNKELLHISILAGAVQVLLTIVLPIKFGWLGVPIATFLYAYVHMTLLVISSTRIVRLDLKTIANCLVRIAAAVLICAPIYTFIQSTGVVMAILSAAMLTAIFFLALYIFGERSFVFLLTREPIEIDRQ